MPSTNTITTAVYRIMSADDELTGRCTLYKGSKRPAGASNPAVTIHTRRLEPGEGAGIWMCDIVVTVHVDTLPNRMIDQETHDAISSRILTILDDTELDLPQGHAHPLIAGDMSEPSWQSRHEQETAGEMVFGLIFIDFGTGD